MSGTLPLGVYRLQSCSDLVMRLGLQEQLGKVLLLGGLVDIQPGPTLHELGAGQSVLTVGYRGPECRLRSAADLPNTYSV